LRKKVTTLEGTAEKGRNARKAPQGRSPRKAGNKMRRARLSGLERKAQIADATLRLMARHGLHGTTVARIAEEVKMEAPSLYAHFPNRQAMLLAAVEVMCQRVVMHLTLPSEPNMLDRLRTLAETHSTYISGEFDGFVLPTFEVLTAPAEYGLIEVASERQRETLKTLAGFVEEGKRQGTIRPDMDSRVAAYEMMVLFWAEDVAKLMGIDEFVTDGISRRILELFLRDMEASPALVAARAESVTERQRT
jgi:AcrR family transcriptional regulator